jgi:hypothetical protein
MEIINISKSKNMDVGADTEIDLQENNIAFENYKKKKLELQNNGHTQKHQLKYELNDDIPKVNIYMFVFLFNFRILTLI